MKKSFIAMLSGIFLFTGCEQLDLGSLNDRLDDMDERISRLEELCSEMNTNIEAMESILEALEKKDCITSVTPVEKDGEVVGYTISFEKGEPITIYNGKDGVNGTDGEDGQDGYTPEIGIRKDTDGLYYWTLDGEWLTDESGSKIPVEGKDGEDGQNGQTPEFKIEDGDWYISYDNGKTWKNLGQATGDPGTPGTGSGDCLFKEVIINDEYVTFIMSDGQSYTLPRTVTGDITVNVEKTGFLTIEFNGMVRLPLTGENGYEVGIICSAEPSFTLENSLLLPIKEKDESDRYRITVPEELDFDMYIYYTYYIKENNMYSFGEQKSFVLSFPIDVTVEKKASTETSVTFDCTVSGIENATGIEYFGIVYSTEEFPDIYEDTYVKIPLTEEQKYEVKLEGLTFGTYYYYRVFAGYGENIKYLTYEYGETFYTNEVNVTADVDYETITETSAVIRGTVDIADDSGIIECGIVYSKSSNFDVESDRHVVITPSDPDGSYEITLEGLTFGTTYYYTYYVKQGDKVQYGYENSFETVRYPIEQFTDLSVNGTANCYIVSEGGLYRFPVFKGNDPYEYIYASFADVLWESYGTSESISAGSLISSAAYYDGYVCFEVPSSFREGNAVIAVGESGYGEILWSWHIWLTDKPEDQVYLNGAGTMMDRNLGATSATPGDVGALGLLYQWGRKDPFLGSSSISESIKAVSTLDWPAAVSSEDEYNGTIEYSIANPTTFILANRKNYDWYYTGDNTVDVTRWQSEKTIYDPCPAGYRIPDGNENGVWSKAFGLSEEFVGIYDEANKGYDFGSSSANENKLTDSPVCWYPHVGYITRSLGDLASVGKFGYYWSCSDRGRGYISVVFMVDAESVYPSIANVRGDGMPVRCVRE